MRKHKRTGVVVAGAASLALILSACGGADDLGGGGGGGGDDTTDDGGDEISADCADFEDYGSFDGSDLMPSEVGAGSFWTAMVDWINGSETQGVLDTVESSWP